MEPAEQINAPAKKIKIRSLSPSQIINKKRIVYQFEDKWRDSFGCPEKHAKWFITGPSYSGKSSFLIMLMTHCLTKFGAVDYNNFEEAGGDSQTVKEKMQQQGIISNERDGQIRFFKAPIESDTHETLLDRLLKRKSAPFAVIDSVQHAEMNRGSYIRLTDRLCNTKKGKSLLFINHWVKNDLAKFIKHDCDIKIEVIGFVAHVQSRYGGNKPFLIWEEGARKHWGKRYYSVISGRYWPGQKK
jgi:hypothetical protein